MLKRFADKRYWLRGKEPTSLRRWTDGSYSSATNTPRMAHMMFKPHEEAWQKQASCHSSFGDAQRNAGNAKQHDFPAQSWAFDTKPFTTRRSTVLRSGEYGAEERHRGDWRAKKLRAEGERQLSTKARATMRYCTRWPAKAAAKARWSGYGREELARIAGTRGGAVEARSSSPGPGGLLAVTSESRTKCSNGWCER